MSEIVPLFKENDSLFVAWCIAVREHGSESAEAKQAWRDYLRDFLPDELQAVMDGLPKEYQP